MQGAKALRTRALRPALRLAASLSCGLATFYLLPSSVRADTFEVINTNAFGTGSLDSAIEKANLNPGADMITFNIPGTGVRTISLTSDLPDITQPVTIDGYSQPGAKPNTLVNGNNAVLLIELNGAGAGASAKGLQIMAPNCIIKGLVINRFAVDGVRISGAPAKVNRIEGCFIGTNAAGTAALANGDDGVQVEAGARNNIIGGITPAARNLISGNRSDGIQLGDPGTIGNRVQGNFIGTNKAGTKAIGNEDGVECKDGASSNLIGGTTSSASNYIAFNRKDGVLIKASAAGTPIKNQIRRNLIFNNKGLGINLQASTEANSTVTLNDTNDVDTGANARQNFPVITEVSSNSTTTTIRFTLNSVPSTSTVSQKFAIEFFSSPSEDSSHFGEGKPTRAPRPLLLTPAAMPRAPSFLRLAPVSPASSSLPPQPGFAPRIPANSAELKKPCRRATPQVCSQAPPFLWRGLMLLITKSSYHSAAAWM